MPETDSAPSIWVLPNISAIAQDARRNTLEPSGLDGRATAVEARRAQLTALAAAKPKRRFWRRRSS